MAEPAEAASGEALPDWERAADEANQTCEGDARAAFVALLLILWRFRRGSAKNRSRTETTSYAVRVWALASGASMQPQGFCGSPGRRRCLHRTAVGPRNWVFLQPGFRGTHFRQICRSSM
jgi:hypothetical protein